MERQTFGVIVTTRSFFPSYLAVEAKKQIIQKLESLGYDYITVTEEQTNFGAVLSYEEAKILSLIHI